MPAALPPLPAAVSSPAAPAPALAADRLRYWGRQWLLASGMTLALCVGIAMVLAAGDGAGFGGKLAYSLCVGVVCMTLVMCTRWLAVTVSARRHVARGLPVPPLTGRAGWQGVIAGSVLAVAAGPIAGSWLAEQVTGIHHPSMGLMAGSPATRVTIVFSFVATVIAVAVLSTLERLSSARAQAEAAQRQAAENQLRLLQSQLEPHMLFNTLANLRVLIGLDPMRAQAMLDHLIAFLRATLAASRSAAHPLSAEFQHLSDYLALMAVRLGPRLSTELDLPPALRALPVPPLLLQPLVENAVKHGLEPKVGGGRLAVTARRDGDMLELVVRDTGVGLSVPTAGGGTSFGLEQVRSRLATLYGERATLTLAEATDTQGGVIAAVRLPLPAAQA